MDTEACYNNLYGAILDAHACLDVATSEASNYSKLLTGSTHRTNRTGGGHARGNNDFLFLGPGTSIPSIRAPYKKTKRKLPLKYVQMLGSCEAHSELRYGKICRDNEPLSQGF